MKKIILISSLVFMFFSFMNVSFAELKNVDMQKDFCGKQIDFKYCLCAFNQTYCNRINLTPRSAMEYVNNRYYFWIDAVRQNAKALCEKSGGQWDLKLDNCMSCSNLDGAQNCTIIDPIPQAEKNPISANDYTANTLANINTIPFVVLAGLIIFFLVAVVV